MRASCFGLSRSLAIGLFGLAAVISEGCNSPLSPPKDDGPKSTPLSADSLSTAFTVSAPAPSQASGPTSGPAFVAAQVQQEVSTPLNATPTYALMPDDLSLLQAQGLLTASDSAALQLLVKQP